MFPAPLVLYISRIHTIGRLCSFFGLTSHQHTIVFTRSPASAKCAKIFLPSYCFPFWAFEIHRPLQKNPPKFTFIATHSSFTQTSKAPSTFATQNNQVVWHHCWNYTSKIVISRRHSRCDLLRPRYDSNGHTRAVDLTSTKGVLRSFGYAASGSAVRIKVVVLGSQISVHHGSRWVHSLKESFGWTIHVYNFSFSVSRAVVLYHTSSFNSRRLETWEDHRDEFREEAQMRIYSLCLRVHDASLRSDCLCTRCKRSLLCSQSNTDTSHG